MEDKFLVGRWVDHTHGWRKVPDVVVVASSPDAAFEEFSSDYQGEAGKFAVKYADEDTHGGGWDYHYEIRNDGSVRSVE